MNLLQKLESWTSYGIGKVIWPMRNPLTQEEINTVSDLCKNGNYILLSRNNNHLSTYCIIICDLFMTGKLGYWGHAFLNIDNDLENGKDFRFIESIGEGVIKATLSEVTDVNSIVVLKPKLMSSNDWSVALKQANADLGKPYDKLFNINQTNSFSCVELIRNALMSDPDYLTNFATFEATVQKHGRITPQMFYDCPDFEVVYETRHK